MISGTYMLQAPIRDPGRTGRSRLSEMLPQTTPGHCPPLDWCPDALLIALAFTAAPILQRERPRTMSPQEYSRNPMESAEPASGALSKKHSPAECNCKIYDKEPLVIRSSAPYSPLLHEQSS